MSDFLKLYTADLKSKVEDIQGFTYLPWASAWAELKRRHPEANYYVHLNQDDEPYFGNSLFGYMVRVTVTVGDLEYTQELPITDSAHNVLKDEPYEFETMRWNKKSGQKEKTIIRVKALDYYDINTAIKRCFVKAIAMHGLGLVVYEGEDNHRRYLDDEEFDELLSLNYESLDRHRDKLLMSESQEKKLRAKVNEAKKLVGEIKKGRNGEQASEVAD